jgi:hypothetical protein
MTRLLTIMGSGETSPTMVKPHREVFEQLSASSPVAGAPVPSIFLDTPFGLNSRVLQGVTQSRRRCCRPP